MFFFFQIPFHRSYWLTFCALGILQSHNLRRRALFLSLITKCNLPYKYTKNSLRGCSVMEKPLNPKKTRFLDFCENCGSMSDSVLAFLRTAVMYQDRFVDAFKGCAGVWQNPVIWIFLEKVHGYIS